MSVFKQFIIMNNLLFPCAVPFLSYLKIHNFHFTTRLTDILYHKTKSERQLKDKEYIFLSAYFFPFEWWRRIFSAELSLFLFLSCLPVLDWGLQSSKYFFPSARALLIIHHSWMFMPRRKDKKKNSHKIKNFSSIFFLPYFWILFYFFCMLYHIVCMNKSYCYHIYSSISVCLNHRRDVKILKVRLYCKFIISQSKLWKCFFLKKKV